jgi:hypothetical protein
MMNAVNELCSQLKKLKGKLAKQHDKDVIDLTIRTLKGKAAPEIGNKWPKVVGVDMASGPDRSVVMEVSAR